MAYPFCIECRGVRDLCRKGYCELLADLRARIPRTRPVGRVIEGPSPPDVFVGHRNYPQVGVGPLVPPWEAVAEGPTLRTVQDLVAAPIEEVVAHRTVLFHTRQSTKVRTRRSLPALLEVAREVALSTSPVDTEVELSKAPPPHLLPRLDPFAAPMGPGVEARRGRVVGRSVVPRRVDQLVSDGDVGAATAVRELHAAGVGEDHIHRLMSVGLLGRTVSRRLVPTRWSITAVDDTVSKGLAQRVGAMQELGEVRLHSSVLKGNHFHVLLIPGVWSFEMIETWVRGSVWASDTSVVIDREGPQGRKDYARNVTGAYYAARLAVLEHLLSIQRQATAVVYREVTEEYWAPLGVWVIREGVRAAMREGSRPVEGLEGAVGAVSAAVRREEWHRDSRFIDDARSQRRLDDFPAGD